MSTDTENARSAFGVRDLQVPPSRCPRHIVSGDSPAFAGRPHSEGALRSQARTSFANVCRNLRFFFKPLKSGSHKLGRQYIGPCEKKRWTRRSRFGVLKRREERPQLQLWGGRGLRRRGGKSASSARSSLPLRQRRFALTPN